MFQSLQGSKLDSWIFPSPPVEHGMEKSPESLNYKEFLESALAKLFVEENHRAEAETVLRGISCPVGWNARVALAYLKLCGSSIDRIRELIAERHDYRDLVSMAEYERSGPNWALKKTDPKRYMELVNQDWNSHNEWLNRYSRREIQKD
jgi:hypothetical protein